MFRIQTCQLLIHIEQNSFNNKVLCGHYLEH